MIFHENVQTTSLHQTSLDRNLTDIMSTGNAFRLPLANAIEYLECSQIALIFLPKSVRILRQEIKAPIQFVQCLIILKLTTCIVAQRVDPAGRVPDTRCPGHILVSTDQHGIVGVGGALEPLTPTVIVLISVAAGPPVAHCGTILCSLSRIRVLLTIAFQILFLESISLTACKS